MVGLNPFKNPKIKLPKIPPLPDPVVMPDPDDPELKRAKLREMLLARQRGGRASTILSSSSAGDSGSTLGIN